MPMLFFSRLVYLHAPDLNPNLSFMHSITLYFSPHFVPSNGWWAGTGFSVVTCILCQAPYMASACQGHSLSLVLAYSNFSNENGFIHVRWSCTYPQLHQITPPHKQEPSTRQAWIAMLFAQPWPIVNLLSCWPSTVCYLETLSRVALMKFFRNALQVFNCNFCMDFALQHVSLTLWKLFHNFLLHITWK